MLNEAVCLVRSFQKQANQPIPPNPCQMSEKQIAKRVKWIESELDELKKAQNEYEQADALIDALYYLLGAFVDMGLNPDELFQIVHRSNMKKVKEPSRIIKDSDNKVLKPNGFRHPDEEIRQEIDKQKNNNMQKHVPVIT